MLHTKIIKDMLCEALLRRSKEGSVWGMESTSFRQRKLWILLLLIGAVYFFLEYISHLVAPVLVAVLFVTIFGPLMKRMQGKLHLPRQLVAVILLAVAVAGCVLILWFMASFLEGKLPEWIGDLESMEKNATTIVSGICRRIGVFFGVDSRLLQEEVTDSIRQTVDYLQEDVVNVFLSHGFRYVGMIIKFCGFFITFLIATVLLAKDYDDIINSMLDREEWHVLLEVICGILRYVASFVKAQLIIMSCISVICALSLMILGVPNGFYWGILAGLLDALPFVGTGIVLLPLIVTALTNAFWGRGLGIVLLMLLCVFLREMLEPKLIGRKIGLPPIAMLIAIYGGIHLFGVWGILKGPLGFVIVYEAYHGIIRRQGLS